MWFHRHQKCVLAGTKEKCSASGDPRETTSASDPVRGRATWNNVGGRGCFVWVERVARGLDLPSQSVPERSDMELQWTGTTNGAVGGGQCVEDCEPRW